MVVLPERRDEDLEIVELPEELVVYDLQRHEAHCLNRTARLVWRHCNGQTTADEMAGLIQGELGLPADEAVVGYAVRQLGKAHLLRERPPAGGAGFSRREFVRRSGLVGAAVLLPSVVSIVAPTAAQAATCVADCTGKPNGTPCFPAPDNPECPCEFNECINGTCFCF